MSRNPEATIQRVLSKLTADEVDAFASDGGKKDTREFKQVADAAMAWYNLLFASNIFRSDEKDRVQEVLASSLMVLGTIVKYAYALGVRRGMHNVQSRKRR